MALLLALPAVASKSQLATLIVIGIHAVTALGLTLLMGYGGQISLAQGAFYGIGAYTSGVLSVKFGLSPWMGLLAGVLLAATIAYVVGVPTLKLKEQYLALATAGIGIIIQILFKELNGLTGGPSGLVGIPYLALGPFEFKGEVRFFYLTVVVAALAFIGARSLVDSRIGRALRAVHGSEVAAEAMGVDTVALKHQIFVLSAVYASVAGSLYAHYVNYISPDLFTYGESIHFAMMVVIGGVASVWGALLGSAVMLLLTDALRKVLPLIIPGAGGDVEMAFFGLLLVVLMIYMPEGLAPGLVKLARSGFGRRKGVAGHGAAPGQ